MLLKQKMGNNTNTIMKKLIFLFWAFLPMILLADEVKINGVWYNLISKAKTAEVIKNPNSEWTEYKGDIVIPETVEYNDEVYTVTSIGRLAFCNPSGIKELHSVSLPSTLTSIAYMAFDGSGIDYVYIKDLEAWCNIVFDGYGSNPLSPESYYFWQHSKLILNGVEITDLVIPNTVTKINNYAFSGAPFRSIEIPSSVKSIGNNAFDQCDSLIYISIPEGTVSIGNVAFDRCTNLSSVFISNTVKTIGLWAFSRCDKLKTITIGSSVTKIETGAFKDCNQLENVYCYAREVPKTSSDIFENSLIEYSTLHVRESSIDAYKEVSPWNIFKEIVKLDIPKYSIKYIVDGDEYKIYEIEEGESITPEPAPIKEGYTFSGWSDIPATMPANDVIVIGTFSVNKYELTYMVDNEVYKTDSLEYGVTITPEAEPTKEGYTFSGWSDVPETMPANDVTVTGTFSINKYKLTYMVDGAEYKSYDVEYGASITPEETPTKEGYTFSGWSEIPSTMPANDVTVTGTFSVNKYKLTYMVDGAEYKSYDVDYGAAITPEPAPTKDGYTFSGWSEIPSTMPANDVTITGSFCAIVIDEDTGEFTATSGSTVELTNDNNVSGEYGIPETITYNGVTYTVTSIGNGAFENNTNLTDVTIPSTITSIGESAFAGCSNLKSITVNSTTPIAFPSASGTRSGSSVFDGVDKNTCVLYVPEGCVEVYKAAPVWGEFANILVIGTSSINSVPFDSGKPQDIYSLDGRKVKLNVKSVDELPNGLYIINGKKVIK